MADEIANSTTAPAASTVASSAGAVPTETPAIVETPATSAPETPIAEPIPAKVDDVPSEPANIETPAESPKPEEAKKPETLLGGEKKTEEKVDEKKEEIKTEENPVETEKVEIPAYEPFTLPEGVEFDASKMGEFTKTLGEFETTSKAPHEEVQKLGQQLVDRHIEELNRYTESLTNAWNKQKSDWKDSFLKDPEFTNRTDTVINSAIDAIGVYGGDTKQQSEFRELMESTGVGNHPAMIRLLSNIMLAKAEPKPLAAPQISQSERISKVQKMYGKKTG